MKMSDLQKVLHTASAGLDPEFKFNLIINRKTHNDTIKTITAHEFLEGAKQFAIAAILEVAQPNFADDRELEKETMNSIKDIKKMKTVNLLMEYLVRNYDDLGNNWAESINNALYRWFTAQHS